MTSKEFVIWLRGFVAGSNNYNLTPDGWQALKDNLNNVSDNFPPYSTLLTDEIKRKPIKKRPKKTVEDWENEIDLGNAE
jgi:hypothetical protein